VIRTSKTSNTALAVGGIAKHHRPQTISVVPFRFPKCVVADIVLLNQAKITRENPIQLTGCRKSPECG